MNSKRWITLLLVFCMVLSGIAPAANAVRISATDSITGGTSNWFEDLMISAGEALGLPTLKKDQSHLMDNDYSLSLKEGQWTATTSDGKSFALTEAQLPKHIQVLRKAAGDFQPTDRVTAFVVLKDAPTADTYGNILEVPSDVEASLMAKQSELITAIEQAVDGVQVIRQYTHLTNAIVITTEFSNLEPIAAVSGVRTVFLNPEFEAMTAKEETMTPFTISSSNMTNVAQVWQNLGYTGQGMTVAILDTGLDVDHPSFAEAPAGAYWDVEKLQQILDSQDLNLEALHGKSITAEDLFYNEKVPFTFNYATGLVNVTHNDSLGDHGTHVAGITAANAVEGTNVSGMAPDAQIFAMKVFSPTGGAGMYTIIDALEDCMKLGVDVVNMSLGSAAGFSVSGDEEVDAIFARIAESDMIVDVAVGNEGSSTAGSTWGTYMMPTTHIDNGTIASPATYANSMGVASVDNKVVAADYFALADGTEVFYQYSIEWMYGYVNVTMAHLHGLGVLDYVIIDGLGNEADFYDADGNSLVDGKVAVIKRGDIEFGRKAMNAQNAGAVAAIIWNTDDSDVFTFGMTTAITDAQGNEIYPDIPVCLITLSDGQMMADAETKTLIVNGDYSFREDNILGGQISSFSCWGTTGDLRLLPDISGIGGNVYSTLDGGEYGLMSGTSMACPQVAGVTTLVMQYVKETFPNATDDETRVLCDSLLMSTAQPIIDKDTDLESSPRQQGAGLVNALGAITAEAYLTVAGSARPKVEMGDNENGEFTFTFTVHNFSDAAKTYTLRSSLLCEDYQLNANFPGVYFLAEEDRALNNSGVTFSHDTITVAAGSSEDITVTIKLTDADKEWIHTYFPSGNYVEGYIYLEGEDEVTLNLPFLGFYERWDDAPLFDTGFWYEPGMWGVPGAAHTANQTYHLMWTSLGSSANDWMLGMNPYMSTVITDENGQTIGVPPYSTYNNVVSPNGDGAADMITDMYLSIMRNADEMEIIYTNEAGEVVHYELLQKDSKTMFLSNYGSVIPMVYSWYYDDLYDFSDLEDGDVVYLTIQGKIDYEDARTDVLFDNMPIYVDLSAPVLDSNSIQESTVDGRNYLTFTFADAHPAAAVLMNKSGSQIYEHYGDSQMIDNGDGTWTVTVDVTGLGDKITIALCDYGCNEVYYDLSYTLTDNAPNMDKTALYAYQVYHDYIFYSQGWDYMFGWATLDKDEATAKMLQSDAYEYYALNAAEYVDNLIFAVDAGNNFMYMQPGVWNRNVICNIGYNVVDMAWDSVSEQMYLLVSDKNTVTYGIFTIDLLTGELQELKNYYYETEMPWAMTFVDGQLYCCVQQTAGFFQVDFENDYALVPVTLEDGTPFVPQGSNGEDVDPMYAQSMTYSAADNKIYWAYYGQNCQCMIVIDPTTWEYFADSFTYDQEYVGLLTMEENSYDLPTSNEITRMIMSQNKLVMSSGRTQQLSVTLLPWNATVTDNVIWTSEDPTVATVDQNGLVTAVGGGNAIITATYGDLQVQCEVQVVDISGNLFAYKYYDGAGRSYYWVNVDLETVTEKPSLPTSFDFLSADYNGHDGMVYGFSDDGQCYSFNPITGAYEALGVGNPSMVPSDMAYDYSTGLMYAIIYNEQAWSTTLYTVNMSSGKLTPVATADDIFVTLACSTEGQLYAINTTGVLSELHVMDAGDAGVMPLDGAEKILYTNYVMQTPADSVYYAQSMCYDHNNDVLLWCNTDYSTIFCLAGLQSAEPYAVQLGEPSGTGMMQYLGVYVVPDEVTELPFTAVTSVEVEDMILMSGGSKQPLVTVNPANATYASIVSVYTDDESVAYYDAKTGAVVAVGAGSTTLHIEVVDAGFDGIIDDLDYRYTAEATVSVKADTDNIYGYLMTDLATMGGFYWISIDDEDPKSYAGESAVVYQGMNLTLYAAEYVNGTIYAYGYDSEDWEANFLFLTIDPKSWSVQSAIDMGNGFPFVYDMAYDYTTGTMYALAGAGSTNTDLYYVNMATGKLVECMITEPMFMSLAIDENGTIYAMASSNSSNVDPETGAGNFGNAVLYTLDVKNGTYEPFMDTGVKSNMLASMAYDFDTGYIYWTGLLSSGKYESGLYLIDPADKSCSNLGTIGRVGSQVTCLMIFADEYPEIPTNLSNLALTTTLAELAVDSTYALELFVTPENADATFTWTSADERVATVDGNGVVTGVSAGSTTVTVTATDGTNTFTASCAVIVYGRNDYFLTYNHTLGGFAKISRPDSTIVTQFTQDEDASPVTAMDFIDGVLYAYDAEGNLFTTSEQAGFVRDYIGHCGITVADPYEEKTSYVDGETKYGYDYYYTPEFRVRDMAYDKVNDRLLVLGAQTLHCVVEYWYESPTYSTAYEYANEDYELQGGCKIYEVDLETGLLTVVCTVGGSEFPMHGATMLAVADNGDVYTYSYYLDYIMKIDLKTGLFQDLATFQNMGIKGSDANDLMAMTYDASTDSLMMLFTTNGNAYSIYKFSLKNMTISFVGYVGDVSISYSYAYGDYFGGLALNVPAALMGDVNGDGFVDTTDAKLIMQYDLDLVGDADLDLSVADVNGDGQVDTTDAKLIMQYDLGLITEFPNAN